MGKIFANHISDKEIIVKIYEGCIQLSILKKGNLINKWAENLNRHFSKDTDDQQVHEKVLNNTNHQGNVNPHHNKISLHICYNG